MRVEWFVEVIVCAFFKGECTLGGLPYLREKDRRCPDVGLAQAAKRFTSVHAWHEDIED